MKKRRLAYVLEFYDGDTLLNTINVRISHFPHCIHWPPMPESRWDWECEVREDVMKLEDLHQLAIKTNKLRFSVEHTDNVRSEWTMPEVKLRLIYPSGTLFDNAEHEGTELTTVQWTHGEITEYKLPDIETETVSLG
jgi:hypothetical protein